MREERRRRLMDVQEDISAELLAAKIGREIKVLVDEVDEEGTIARSSADAPEIDGLVFINSYFNAEPGDFLSVKVIDADEHDLYAELVNTSPWGVASAPETVNIARLETTRGK